MMLKVVFATVFLTGLNVLACQAQAVEACPTAETYIRAEGPTTDKDLATAIECLAAKLPRNIAQAKPADIEAVGRIQMLASKIIGNGKQMASVAAPVKAASAAGIAEPKVIDKSKIIANGKEASSGTPGHAQEVYPAEVASKIIGNGRKLVVQTADAAAVSPKPRPAPGPSANVQNATAISCEAEKLLEKMSPGKAASPECSAASGTSRAIKRYANKIIGNG